MAELRDCDVYVLPWVAGAPRPAIDDALRQSAIRFCKETYAVNETIKLKAPAKPEVTVVSTDSNLVVHSVLEVYGPGGLLDPTTKSQLQDMYPDGWQAETVDAAADLHWWMSLGESTIRLIPYLTTATIEKVLTIETSLRPSDAAETLPNLLLTRWPEIIAAGALALLHSHEGMPYAVPGRVAGMSAVFKSGISKAADEVEAGYNRPQLRTGLDEFP